MNKQIFILSAIALTGILFLLASQNNSINNNNKHLEISQFAQFRTEFEKKYSSTQELDYRFNVFLKNLQIIENHNSDQTNTYTLGVNQFSDLTFEEFSAFYLGRASSQKDEPEIVQNAPEIDFSSIEPKEINWVEKGIVSEVKNQGSCGSCWAFSAVSVVEEAYAQFKNQKLNLSEQELVDCSRSYGNQGCSGGFENKGLSYVAEKRINLDEVYPYHAVDQKCKKEFSGKGVATIENWKPIEEGFEKVAEILKNQPTTASFYVQDDFFLYKSGVYQPKGSCNGSINHAVNFVGYNVNAAIPYLLVRNSWGKKWGDNGYFKIKIVKGSGTCKITSKNENFFINLKKEL